MGIFNEFFLNIKSIRVVRNASNKAIRNANSVELCIFDSKRKKHKRKSTLDIIDKADNSIIFSFLCRIEE